MPICYGRGYSPPSGVDWVSRSAIRPAAGRTIEAVVLYALQRDGQEKQLCYSPRSWPSKSNITEKINYPYRRGSRGRARGTLAPPPPTKNPHKYEFVWLNSLRQHNSQARIQGGQGGLGPPPYKILDPPMP